MLITLAASIAAAPAIPKTGIDGGTLFSVLSILVGLTLLTYAAWMSIRLRAQRAAESPAPMAQAAVPVAVEAVVVAPEPVAAPVALVAEPPVVEHVVEPAPVAAIAEPVPIVAAIVEPVAAPVVVMAAPLAEPEQAPVATTLPVPEPAVVDAAIAQMAGLPTPMPGAPVDDNARPLSPQDKFGPRPSRELDDELRRLDRAMTRAFSAPKSSDEGRAQLPMEGYPPVAEEGEFRSALSRALSGDD